MLNQNIKCPCKRNNCERHGKCKECMEYHATKNKYLTACERLKVKETSRKNK